MRPDGTHPELVYGSITPDVRYNYDRGWPRRQCFRDPVPIARDYILVSHAPATSRKPLAMLRDPARIAGTARADP